MIDILPQCSHTKPSLPSWHAGAAFPRHSCSLHHSWTIASLLSLSCLVSLNSPLLTTQAVLTHEEFKKLNDIRTVCDFHDTSYSILFLKLWFGASFSVLFLLQRKPPKMQLPYRSTLRPGSCSECSTTSSCKMQICGWLSLLAIPEQPFPSKL